MLESKIKEIIREIKDFPKQGIYFKDITPLLKNPDLCNSILDYFADFLKNRNIDAIAAIESRGFWFGFALAQKMGIPFVPIRKLGKLPYQTMSYSYELEYGKATMEIHEDALEKGWRVHIHDDLLATGGTACAAAELVNMQEAIVDSFSFVVNLNFLAGSEKLYQYASDIISVSNFEY
jgi:adenine phosphoribosyltransferase